MGASRHAVQVGTLSVNAAITERVKVRACCGDMV
jgi:hypothetical protein